MMDFQIFGDWCGKGIPDPPIIRDITKYLETCIMMLVKNIKSVFCDS